MGALTKDTRGSANKPGIVFPACRVKALDRKAIGAQSPGVVGASLGAELLSSSFMLFGSFFPAAWLLPPGEKGLSCESDE